MFKNFFYPPLCAVCGTVGSVVCEACWLQIKPIEGKTCTTCGIPLVLSARSSICTDCMREKPALISQYSLFVFDGAVRELITQLKYHAQFWVVPFMLKLSPLALSCEPDVIVPVPLFKKRLKKRGYNQGVEIARALVPQLKCDMDYDTLVRLKDTATQTGLSRAERRENLQGAFAVTNNKMIVGKEVLLIDDVCTTGATLNSAAEVLLAAGARTVHGLTLAITQKERRE